MKLPISTSEKTAYRDYWSCNAAHFEKQGCYAWMAEQLRPLRPSRILDVGCGTGEGLLALLAEYSPSIISLEENADCILHSHDLILSAGYGVEKIFRLGYEGQNDGTHVIHFDQSPIVTSNQVALVHADPLMPDPAIDRFLAASPRFDAVTVWLIGTFMMRRTCRNLSCLRIADGNEYRLRVQNCIYLLADRVLRPGGWLQIVDRGEPLSTDLIKEDALNSHREQAQPTTLEPVEITCREYTEPKGKGVSMVASPGTSGRIPALSSLAMLSVISRKPE